jgi:hypothetical protein
MLDRVGVLNTKLVQSPEIKMAIQNALYVGSRWSIKYQVGTKP